MKIDITKIENKMPLDIKEIHGFLMAHRNIVWSWGAKSWTNVQNKGFAFNVNGFNFKGNVMITVNGSDLFDIYFHNRMGKVVNEINNIYLDDLIEVLDNQIEKTETYEKDVKEYLKSVSI